MKHGWIGLLGVLALLVAGCPEEQDDDDVGDDDAADDDGGDDDGGDDDGGDDDTQPWPNDNSPLALNLSGINSWMAQWAFVDGFRQSRDWIPQEVDGWTWDTGEPIDLDEHGWVQSLSAGQAAGTLIFDSGHYPAGEYVLLHEGSGGFDIQWDATVTSTQPGRITMDVIPDEGIHLKLIDTDPGDPVRNIRFVMPGYEGSYETEPFHPLFLQRLETFASLRFMDWAETNGSPIAHWDERATLDDANQSGEAGVALELMIQLANTLHADPWFCMPHLADDDFVTQFATMVRDQLDPGLVVHVEYSNEVWNGQFEQAGYAEQQGLDLGLSGNGYEARLRYYSQRSVEIFGLWEQVFGGPDRLVRVLASQSANPWTAETVLDWDDAYLHADALAIAPYFGGYLGDADTQYDVQNWTLDEMFTELDAAVAGAIADMGENAAVADTRGLALIAYEGGQHLVGTGGAENNETLEQLFHDTNRDPRMGDRYRTYLDGWKAADGQLFAAFNYCAGWSKWGSWSALETQDQDQADAPKYDALVTFIADEPVWW